MKILFVNRHIAPIGGTETYLRRIIDGCKTNGLSPMVAYTSSDEEKNDLDCEVIHLTKHETSQGMKKIREFAPDLIHFNNLPTRQVFNDLSSIAPSVLMLHSQFPIICPGDGKFSISKMEPCKRKVGPYCLAGPIAQRCGTRNILDHGKNYVDASYFKENINKVSQIIVASQFMKDELIANDYNSDSISVLPLGIPDVQNTYQPKKEIWPIFLFVGRFVPSKGAQVLIDALDYVQTSVSAVFIGSGRQQSDLDDLKSMLPDRHSFTFTGWQDEETIQKWYARATAVVVPSLWDEPFGLVGIEAMRAGKPVIGFDRGGITEWLKNNDTGLLTDPNPASLAEAIELIAKDPAFAEKLGTKGRESFENKFTIDHHLQKLNSLYKKLIQE
jgi:glycosyltransferase involved in cell wall biosynthesis